MKLVRDNIPDMHAAGQLGEHPNGSEHRDSQVFRRATQEEYRLFLRTKLAEEVGEAISAVRRDHILEELGDVYQMLDTLTRDEGFTMLDVMTSARMKAERYGGFAEGWVLEEKENRA